MKLLVLGAYAALAISTDRTVHLSIITAAHGRVGALNRAKNAKNCDFGAFLGSPETLISSPDLKSRGFGVPDTPTRQPDRFSAQGIFFWICTPTPTPDFGLCDLLKFGLRPDQIC